MGWGDAPVFLQGGMAPPQVLHLPVVHAVSQNPGKGTLAIARDRINLLQILPLKDSKVSLRSLTSQVSQVER